MKLDNFLRFNGMFGGFGLIFASGSFGIIDKVTDYEVSEENGVKSYFFKCKGVSFTTTFEEKDGIFIRKDYLENISDTEIEINSVYSRFGLDGNCYEVYTQYNGWEHESKGNWQKLVTSVTAKSEGIRSCDGATPIMALHNVHTKMNTVFHLFPNASWQMTAKKFPANKKETIVIETGFNNENLHLKVAPHEKISLPEIWFFNAKNKTDLDAFKLHSVYNKLYPRRSMPVLYNSWLYCFDNLDVDAILNQVDTARELGIEAFMIDAGWFGNGENWADAVGDWEEKEGGRLIEISEKVREKGMIFGLWFEPERASPESNSVKTHPEYYIENSLLDFANPDAVNYILEILSKQIEKYNIGFMKFDFNSSIPVDPSGNAFYRYYKGQERFITALREKFPHLYITNCASGGYRMELNQGRMFDSFWLSDNQGPFEGIRIVKDTLKRMPTALIERWNVQKYSEGFPHYDLKSEVGMMLSCNNGTWDFITSVKDSFTSAFINCGPVGFSCDIAAFPDGYKKLWKENIKAFKQNRDFYKNAVARILVDTDDIIAIQYSDSVRFEIVLFTKTTYANNLIVYPVLDEGKRYSLDNGILSGKEITENGICFDNLADNSAYVKILNEVK